MTRTFEIILNSIKLTVIGLCLIIVGCVDISSKPDNSQNLDIETTKHTEINQNDQNQIKKLALENHGGLTINLDNQIDDFATKILDFNKVKHSAEYLSRSEVGHVTIFNFDGLKNYYAYSDKRYPKNSQPTYYENFTLFVFEYESEVSASNCINLIYANTNLTSEQLDSIRKNNPKLLNNIETSLKPGGLIIQKNNYVFSLVKTCRKPPVKNNWKEYEDIFIRSISTDGQTIKTLNAKCGMMNYSFEKRKPTDNK